MSPDSACTLAVIGHDEEATLGAALTDALHASRAGDRVVFVDSASTDGSVGVAASLGVEVLPAPLGKGRAVSDALATCATPWLLTLDADLTWSERSPAGVLRAAVARHPAADMIVGHLGGDQRPRSITPFLYMPLVGALVPEALDAAVGPYPLSGFRALRVAAAVESLPFPPGYGLETHLNLTFALAGRAIETVEIGDFRDRLRVTRRTIGDAVTAAILDAAERHERLSRSERPAWEDWAERVIVASSVGRGDGALTPEQLGGVAAAGRRPLPRAVPART